MSKSPVLSDRKVSACQLVRSVKKLTARAGVPMLRKPCRGPQPEAKTKLGLRVARSLTVCTDESIKCIHDLRGREEACILEARIVRMA